MFIPIGNEDAYLRRTPWVSLGIIAACVGVYLWTSPQEEAAAERIQAASSALVSYAAQRPYLELPEDLSQEARRLIQHQRLRTVAARESLPYQTEGPPSAAPPDDPEVLRLEQEALDDLAHALEAALRETPARRLGLTPSRPTLLTLFTSMFVHSGFLHLLGNLWFFYFLGLVLEDTYGHGTFAALYLAAGLVGALLYLLAFRHSDVPLVGASGAIAGVMGAYMVRHGHDRIRIFWFLFMRWGTFVAPAWGLLALWFVEQLFMAATTPAAEGGGIAYLTHVGGFLAGAGGASLLRYLGWEKPEVRAAVDALEVAPRARGPLSTARQLLSQGEAAGALVAAQQAAEHDPQSVPVAEVLWRIHERLGAMDQAHAAALRVLRGHLRAGNGPGALATWQAIRAAFRDERPPAERWRLVGLLTDAEARPLLESLAGDPAAGGLQDKARQRLRKLAAQRPVQAGTAGRDAEDIVSILHAPMEPSAPSSASSPPAAAPPGDGTELVRAHRVRPVQLIGPSSTSPSSTGPSSTGPRSTGPSSTGPLAAPRAGAALVFEDGRRLPLSRVQRVVAGVVGEGTRRVVLDLVTSPPESRPAVTVRVTSADMDPAALLGLEGVTPAVAFDALLRRLGQDADAPVVPADGALASFPSLADYERAYFAPARRNAAS